MPLTGTVSSTANLYFAYMLTLCAIYDCRERLNDCSYLGDGAAVLPSMRAITGSDLVACEAVQASATAQSPPRECCRESPARVCATGCVPDCSTATPHHRARLVCVAGCCAEPERSRAIARRCRVESTAPNTRSDGSDELRAVQSLPLGTHMQPYACAAIISQTFRQARLSCSSWHLL